MWAFTSDMVAKGAEVPVRRDKGRGGVLVGGGSRIMSGKSDRVERGEWQRPVSAWNQPVHHRHRLQTVTAWTSHGLLPARGWGMVRVVVGV